MGLGQGLATLLEAGPDLSGHLPSHVVCHPPPPAFCRGGGGRAARPGCLPSSCGSTCQDGCHGGPTLAAERGPARARGRARVIRLGLGAPGSWCLGPVGPTGGPGGSAAGLATTGGRVGASRGQIRPLARVCPCVCVGGGYRGSGVGQGTMRAFSGPLAQSGDVL